MNQDAADRIKLSSSIWNYHRLVYLTKPARVGCLLAPAALVLILLTGSSTVATISFVVVGAAQLVGIWSQLGAYATRTALAYRPGIFSGRREVPLTEIRDLVVEPVPVLGELFDDIGDITVKFASGFHVFEGVPRAHAVVLDLLSWRDAAVARSREPS